MKWLALAAVAVLLQSCTIAPSIPADRQSYILTVGLPDHSGDIQSSATRVYGGGDRWRIPIGVRKNVRLLVRDYDLTVLDSWPLASIREYCVVVTGRSRDIEALGKDSRIASLQPVQRFTGMKATPPYNDARLVAQLGPDIESFNRLHTWSTGKGVRIGIIDTPVDLGHPDLRQRFRLEETFTDGAISERDRYHGTAVAGIIGAKADNGIGVVGFAPDAELYSFAACRREKRGDITVCNTFALAKAIEAAAGRKLDLVNLSLAGPEDALLERLISSLIAGGTIVVASDNPEDDQLRFPASMNDVVAVSAPGHPADSLTIHAEDEHLSTRTGGGYQFFYGSSMSAARVTALVSLMLEQQPTLATDEVRARLGGIEATCRAEPHNDLCFMRFALSGSKVSRGGAQFSKRLPLR